MTNNKDDFQIPPPRNLKIPSITPYWNLKIFFLFLKNLFLKKDFLKKDFSKLLKEVHNIDFNYYQYFNSASSAIYFTLKAFKVESGDKVIIPSFTCRSVLFAILKANAIPVLADIDCEYNVDLKKICKYVKCNKVKAIIMPNMYGKINKNYSLIKEIQEYGVIVIEDNAISFGSSYVKKIISDAVIYSFNIGKVINGSGGGLVFFKKKFPYPQFDNAKKNDNLKKWSKFLKFIFILRYRKIFSRLIRFFRKNDYGFSLNVYYSNKDREFLKNSNLLSFNDISLLSLSLVYAQVVNFALLSNHMKSTYNQYEKKFNLKIAYDLNEMPNYCILPIEDLCRYELGRYFSKYGIEAYWSYYPIHKIDLYKYIEKIDTLLVTEEKWSNFLYLPLNFYTRQKNVDKIYEHYLEFIDKHA
jgi:dTDP-4-amino-4,6-dideoxygalactose transaminase